MDSIKDSIVGDIDPNFEEDSYGVGPKINDELINKAIEEENVNNIKFKTLTIIIPTFDPGIKINNQTNNTNTNNTGTGTGPITKKVKLEENIFPELRAVESKRFALNLKKSLEESNLVGAIRVTPDASASGEIYILGTIKESNATEVKINIKVIDVSGRLLLDRNFSHDVDEGHFTSFRSKKIDAYKPVFDKAAKKIADILQKFNQKSIKKLATISELRFASEFTPESFKMYLNKNKGIYSLNGIPNQDDPMLLRVKAIQVREQFFVDTLQEHYEKFDSGIKTSYLLWQKQTFAEQKARDEATTKKVGRTILGVLAIGVAVAAAAAGANSGSSDFTGAMLSATLGAQLLEDAQKYKAEANMHKSSVVELGRSIEAEMAPSVIRFDEKTIELQGNATQQFIQWRSFLKKIFELEKIPEKQL